jgi:hypothetical protein
LWALCLLSTGAAAQEWKPPQDVRQYCGFLENDIVAAYTAEINNNNKAGQAIEQQAAPYEFQQSARGNRERRLQSEDEWQRLGCAQILYRTNPPPH